MITVEKHEQEVSRLNRQLEIVLKMSTDNMHELMNTSKRFNRVKYAITEFFNSLDEPTPLVLIPYNLAKHLDVIGETETKIIPVAGETLKTTIDNWKANNYSLFVPLDVYRGLLREAIYKTMNDF